MEGEIVLPGIDGSGGDESGFTRKGCRLPDDEGGLMVKSSGAEKLFPVEAGSLGFEVGRRPGVIRFMNVLVFGKGEMLLGDSVFEGDDAGGSHLGLVEATEAEDRDYVLPILCPDLFHVIPLREV